MDDNRRPYLNPSTFLLSVGLFSLGLSALGWVAMQWHQHLYRIDVERLTQQDKINVERLTQQVRQACGTDAERQAVYRANQLRLEYPEEYGNLKEGWYSTDDYDRDYKTCVETTPPTEEDLLILLKTNVAYLTSSKEVDKPSENKPRISAEKSPVSMKFCPVGGELYPATVKFCPNHGVELREKR